jgi:hypothetical protein
MGGLHLSPEVLDGAKLKLLYGTLAAFEFQGNLADAFLLHKSHVNHLGIPAKLNAYSGGNPNGIPG